MAAARAGDRALQCRRRLAELRARRPVSAADVARAQALLAAAQSSASVAEGRLLLTRARTSAWRAEADVASAALAVPHEPVSVERLRQRIQAVGVHNVFVAAFGVGGTTSMFDFEAFAHGLAGLPDIEVRAIEQAVWELEHF
jgi:hypothetical protein